MANSQKSRANDGGRRKEEEEADLQSAFEQEIKKPYYDVFYLDNFKLPYDKLDVSVVIATYNRCPYKPGTLKEDQNPLLWSIKTAMLQKPRIKELILVDDNSTDYTSEFFKKISKEAQERDIRFEYIKNKKRLGPGTARNIGSRKSSSKYILFVDDDSFIAPHSAFGAVYTFEELEKRGIKVGMINLPTYSRASIPTRIVSQKEIGTISFLNGTFKSNKEAFPLEYLSLGPNEKFLDNELHILNAFPILNANTTSLLCSKKAFEEVGGFSNEEMKRMEDRDFGCKIVDNGYSIYFQPDPKFHCVHGSYGLKNDVDFVGEDWFKRIDKSISLKKAMAVCNCPQENTGARVDPYEYIYQSILSFFYLAYFRNKKGAINWIKRVHRNFVLDGKTDIFGNPHLPLPDEHKRKKMWLEAISKGLEFIKLKEKKDLKKIDSTIRRLQNNEAPDDILSLIGEL